MDTKTRIYFLIFTGIFVLSVFTVIVFTPHSFPTSSLFPFHVDGGTLLESDSELQTAIIWGQGFTITLTQISITPRNLFNITVLNFPTNNIQISGLLTKESCNILSDTSCILKVMNSAVNRSIVISAPNTGKITFKFLTMGDTQGFSQLYSDMLKHPLTSQSEFILHAGDITPSGSGNSLEIFRNISLDSSIPIYLTPGNHDIKENNSTDNYEQYFGKADYYFNFSNILFISLNSSAGYFSDSSMLFLSQILIKFPLNTKIIFTHMPLFDPRPDESHSLINKSQATQIISMLSNNNVKAVISGHIHLFNHTIINNIHFITSGGGGARLYADPEEGGYHHFTEITFNLINNEITVNPILMTKETTITDIMIRKGPLNQTITLFDLQSEFPQGFHQGFSSFQNQYNNWRAYGYYEGIKISSLLQIVGGLNSSEILQIEAWDGFSANYSYPVIYPNSSWQDIQGEMILAFSFNGSYIPDYTDGYRVVFTPPDGGYSNDDCRNTSPPGEGWYIYQSAGYRWLKYIKSLTILQMVNNL